MIRFSVKGSREEELEENVGLRKVFGFYFSKWEMFVCGCDNLEKKGLMMERDT